ncbi:hypothetical protein BDV93DRAFT_561794 [Ceratobasidium sp. AG-I]|nr:hypothetical protein BDV93DRAFT_561794 [Ceratobasidium sp. AG-I]
MILILPKLEYSLSVPYPDNRWFQISTIVLFILSVPVLILVNIVTQGYELVPSLQSQFQPNLTLAGWWGSTRLPSLLSVSPPPCEPKDLGRGDIFRLTPSLFDYTVMSTWNTSKANSGSQAQEQGRVEYRGEPFTGCRANTVQFDYSMLDDTQTVTVGVICPGTTDYPVYVSMETKMVFAWLLSKDFVGQYYGPGLDLLNINTGDSNDYRKLAFAVLEAISTDSLTIIDGQHLSNPVLSITAFFNVTFVDGKISTTPESNSLKYLNGTKTSWPAEAQIYDVSIVNLMNVAAHTVNLDLGSAGPENIYLNSSALNGTIGQNLAPPNIAPADWAQNSKSFYYGTITPPYQTWAQMLRARQTIALGTVTGLPPNSSMVTTYLCPSYQLKQRSSFLSSIFVGTATMFLSAWGSWILLLTFLAGIMHEPCLDCKCPKCKPELWTLDKNGKFKRLPLQDGPANPGGHPAGIGSRPPNISRWSQLSVGSYFSGRNKE